MRRPAARHVLSLEIRAFDFCIPCRAVGLIVGGLATIFWQGGEKISVRNQPNLNGFLGDRRGEHSG